MYQADIDKSVDWAGSTLPKLFDDVDKHGWHRVPDAAGNYPGQCVSYIKREYTHRTGKPAPATGTGFAEGWLKLPGTLKHDFAVEGFSPKKEYPKGSYIFNTPTHHVAIYLGKSGANVIVSEQNADPDGSGVHTVTRAGNRFDMIMVPHVDEPPASHPTPKPVHKPYTVKEIDPKQVKVKKGMHEWTLKYTEWDDLTKHPHKTLQEDKIMTVRAEAHHILGGRYYMEDPDVGYGYNVVDCAPYVPPKKSSSPAGALPVPTSTDPYQVKKTLLGFTSSNNAVNRTNAVSSVSPGKYFIYNRRYDTWDKTKLVAVNVTKKVSVAGVWINVADNVPEVAASQIAPAVTVDWKTVNVTTSSPEPAKVPEPPVPDPTPAVPVVPVVPSVNPNPNQWKSTNQPFLPNFQPIKVVTNNEQAVVVHDMEDPRPGTDLSLPPFKELHIVSTFQKDGVTYARPAAAAKQYRWYGVPWELVSEEKRKLTFGNVIGEILYRWNMLIQDVKKYK